MGRRVVVFDLDGTLSDPLPGFANSSNHALRDAGAVDGDPVMVGDRAVDITSAHRNGLHACGVLWGFGSREELQSEAPRHLAEAPAQLRRLGRADPL